jgi:DNA-binding transcriptional LysR family regulator
MSGKLEAMLRGLGCGFLPEPIVRPHIEAGRLVLKTVAQPKRLNRVCYAWRQQSIRPGHALDWWLKQLSHATTRTALLSLHGDLLL